MRPLVVGFLLSISCATVPSSSDTVSAIVTQATEAKKAVKWTQAAELYERALKSDPRHLAALRGLVETHHLMGRLGELEVRFQRDAAARPGDPFPQHALGLVYFARGGAYGDKAIERLRKAVELAPEEADFAFRLGLALVENDRHIEAAAVLADAVKRAPSQARYRVVYAVCLMKTARRTEAVAQLAKVLELEPTPDELALATKTASRLLDPFQGFPQAAREQFESALQWLDAESTTQAQQAFQQLLERFPDLAIVHAMYGVTSMKKDEAGRAISAYRRAIELSPELAEPHLFLADLYAARGRPDTAITHYRDALTRNPYLADAHKRFGEALERTEDLSGALDSYRVYLLLRPDDFDAAFARAGLLEKRDPAASDMAWDKLENDFPTRPEGRVAAGRHWFVRSATGTVPAEKKAWKEKSRRSLDVAFELDPENESAAAIRAELEKLPW